MLIAQRPTLTEKPLGPNRSQFVVEPLEPGFGYTLGNSLRRTLLSSIPGAAVTNLRLDGVMHEFSTIEGVKEDLAEIILNVKRLVLTSEHDEPVLIYVNKTGPGELRARDISLPAGIEIRSPDLLIATLNESATLGMQMTVERGRGYVSAEQNRGEYVEAGVIPIDSIYSPVERVTYRVEATRAGERTDFDRLIVDVETKNSITPGDAVASAGSTLVELFGLMRELNLNAEGVELGEELLPGLSAEQLSATVDDLQLSTRTKNSLQRNDIHYVSDLIAYSEAELLALSNLGEKSVDEIQEKLGEIGLSLKNSVSDDAGNYYVPEGHIS